jgi:hypothetical protein
MANLGVKRLLDGSLADMSEVGGWENEKWLRQIIHHHVAIKSIDHHKK